MLVLHHIHSDVHHEHYNWTFPHCYSDDHAHANAICCHSSLRVPNLLLMWYFMLLFQLRFIFMFGRLTPGFNLTPGFEFCGSPLELYAHYSLMNDSMTALHHQATIGCGRILCNLCLLRARKRANTYPYGRGWHYMHQPTLFL